MLARIVHGSRISLEVGFLARTISLLIGLFLGSLAGYFGGRLDSVLMRLADITFAYPTLLLLIAIIAVVSPGMVSLFVTLGVVMSFTIPVVLLLLSVSSVGYEDTAKAGSKFVISARLASAKVGEWERLETTFTSHPNPRSTGVYLYNYDPDHPAYFDGVALEEIR